LVSGWFRGSTLCWRTVSLFGESLVSVSWSVASIRLASTRNRRLICDGMWWLIYAFACCALIGQFEFKDYMNWSSRSIALASTRHTLVNFC
jgi:hypothetical protein